MSRFYATTPIYYVNDEPHIGHAYTTIVADAAGPLAPPARRATSSSSPAPTSTASRSSRPPPPPASTPRRSPTASRRASPRPGSRSTSPTTTSSAPPSRGTTPRSTELLQRCYDAGDIELDYYRGKYCVRCEAYYTDDELLAGRPVPDPQDARSTCSRRRTTSSASRRFEHRLLDWYAAHPGAIVPEFRGNEALGLIRSGPARTSRSAAPASRGASRCRGTASTSPTCGSTRSPTTSAAVGFGTDRRRVRRRGGRPTSTSSARTSSASTACTGRRC